METSKRKYFEEFLLTRLSISKGETSKIAKIERINVEKDKFRWEKSRKVLLA